VVEGEIFSSLHFNDMKRNKNEDKLFNFLVC